MFLALISVFTPRVDVIGDRHSPACMRGGEVHQIWQLFIASYRMSRRLPRRLSRRLPCRLSRRLPASPACPCSEVHARDTGYPFLFVYTMPATMPAGQRVIASYDAALDREVTMPR